MTGAPYPSRVPGMVGGRPGFGRGVGIAAGPAVPRLAVALEETLPVVLDRISPLKKALRAGVPAGVGFLDLRPLQPFGPTPMELAEFLLGRRVQTALDLFRDRFRQRLLVTGAQRAERDLLPGAEFGTLPRSVPRGAALDLCEFCLLVQAAEGSFLDGCLVSCFIVPAESVVTVRVPAGSLLGESLAAHASFREALGAAPSAANSPILFGGVGRLPVASQACDRSRVPAPPTYLPIGSRGCGQEVSSIGAAPDLRLREALTGNEIPASARAAQRLLALTVSAGPYRPQATPSFFFPFPFFARRLAMQPGAPANAAKEPATPCCNCLACARWCPAGIRPSHLYHHLRRGQRADAEGLGLMACMRCNWCTAVCPAHLPLAETLAAAQDAVQAEETP